MKKYLCRLWREIVLNTPLYQYVLGNLYSDFRAIFNILFQANSDKRHIHKFVETWHIHNSRTFNTLSKILERFAKIVNDYIYFCKTLYVRCLKEF